ncbi:MAG: hypothetical protein HY901_20770 [Deltaproteobacteria bacterium]|nr:hypothetical protein [Deltaproteobacteria bacterium]
MPEPADVFCGQCGASLVLMAPAPGEGPGIPAVPSVPSAPAAPARRSSGCGCTGLGCLGLLLVVLAGAAVAGWLFLSENGASTTRVSGLLEELEKLVEPLQSSKPWAGAPAEEVAERGRQTAPDRAALLQTARQGSTPVERLQAIGTLLETGASEDEVRELEGVQDRALTEVEAGIERERRRREQLAREAAAGDWLRASGAEADAVWRAAGGQR